jgi:hypothetical protein
MGCTEATRKNAPFLLGSTNRSKFNVPLGVEAQGFCVLPS